jgi:Transposase DDE domain group 1
LRYGAQSWAQPWSVGLKAAGMSAGDTPRFVVTALDAPTPQRLDEDLYGARGHGANASKAVQVDRRRDRTSAPTSLANATRLVLAWAA